jgi:ABC-type transport system substrate-binding protein
MQRYWGAIGVAANIPPPERWDSLQAKLQKGELEFDVIIRNKPWNPSGNQGSVFHGDPPGADNLAGWGSPEYDALDDQQVHEFDPEKRRELLIQLSSLAWNEMPIGVLHFIRRSVAYSPSLHNFEPHALAGTYWSMPFVWKDAPAP